MNYATKAEYSGSKSIYNVRVVKCTNHVTDTDDGTQCIYCNQTAAEGAVAKIKKADGKSIYYSELETAVEKANNGDTITMLDNVALAEPLSIEADESNSWRNNLTLDLNGKTISCNKVETTTIFTSITLTICDSSNEKTGEITQNAAYAVRAGQGGTLKITGGKFGGVYAIDGSEISGGTFSKIWAYDFVGSSSEKLHTVLAKGYAFADSTGNIVNGYEKSNAENVTVVSHPKHSGNPCACGYPCENTTEMNDTGHCPDCGELLAQAKVTVNGETTYTTDFRNAVQNAVDGTTVTLLQNVTLAENEYVYIQKGSLTIDWNGYTLSGDYYSNLLTITQHTSATLKDSSVNGKGGVRNVGGAAVCVNIVGSYNVTIEGGVYSPQVNKYRTCQGQFRIKGGIFENPSSTGINFALLNDYDKLSNLLAEGYTFAYDENGTELIDVYENRYSDKNKTVYVVSHTHSNFDENDKCECGFTCEHTTVDSDNNCTICGKAIVAKVGDKGYTSIEKAIADAKGGTVKLLTNAENITINESLTLDLNGKNVDSLMVSAKATIKDSAETKGVITSLTVSGDLKIKDLLEKDYSFKTGESTWATAEQLEGKSIQTVGVVQVPIRSISIDTKNLTANYGYAADNSPELTCVLNDGGSADGATYQWYRVGEATSIADTKVYTVPTGFDAGEYKYYCVAAIDGYSVTSKTVTVEIKKVTPTYTAPTANEGLSYTGLAQNLIEAGSTGHGTIEYSLDENGTYSTAIPTGTNAGTYTVWYKVVGDNNHNDVDPQSLTVKIEKCKISISGFAIAPKTYTNGDNTATVTEVTFANLQNNENLVLDADFTAAAEFENANAGTRSATLTITLSEGAKAENYELEKNTLAKEFTIEQAEAPVLSNVSESVTYGDNTQKTVSVPAMPTDAGTLTYTEGGTSATNVDWSVGTDGTVKYTVSGANARTVITLPIVISSTNYKDTKVNVVITITKAAPNLEITNEAALNRTYDGNSVDAVYTTNGDGALTVEYYEGNSKLVAAPTDAGTYKVIVKLAEGTNYEATQTEAEFTIAKRSIEGAAISLGDELVYTGKEQTQAVKSVTVKLDEAISLEATYDVSENTGTNAGTYTLTVTGNGNFEGTATKAFEIKQAEVTLTEAVDNTPVQNAIYKDTEVIKATFKNKKVTVNFNGQEVELEGVWTLTETSEGEKFESTGEFDREAVFTPADSNFAPITQTVKIKVTTRSSGAALLPTTEVKTADKAGQTGEKVTTSPSEVKNETKTDASGNQVTTAKVTVSAANQKEILKQAKDNKSSEILIKVSEKDVKDGAKLELSLDKSFIEDILNNTDADLTIQTPDGEKTFTQEELKKLVEAATGSTITLDPTASTDPTNPSEPTNPDGTLTPAQSKLVKGVQNTTIVLKSKLTKKGKIRLTWTKSKGYKLDRFEIYRSIKKNSGYGKKAFFTTKDGSWSKYLNTKSLKKGKTYYYKLRGIRIIDGKKYYTQWSNKTWRTVK